MIKRSLHCRISFVTRLWLLILAILAGFHGHTVVAGERVITIADPPANQRAAGSSIYFNQSSQPLACDDRERTPGYITTIFLSNSPFSFGCLSKDTSSYYFTVALTGVNFPNTPVWVANRYHPVKDKASLSLLDGSLVLRDADGTSVWSTAAVNATVLHLTNAGNLILFNNQNTQIWESFSEPVDLLVPGQFLNPGSTLVAGFSSHFLSTGSFTAVMNPGGIIFYENSTSKPLPYYALKYPLISTTAQDVLTSPCNNTQLQITELNLTQVEMPLSPACNNTTSMEMSVTFDSPIVFIRLEPNGVLKGYYPDHKPAYDVFRSLNKGLCGFPNSCGPYGICEGLQCVCPSGNGSDDQLFLETMNEFLLTSTGCTPKVPLNCRDGGMKDQFFLDVESVDYFANDFISPTMVTDSLDQCKAACAGNCSCKAAFFRAESKQCFLHESVMSMIRVNNDNYVGSIKLQNTSSRQRKSEMGLIIGISIATVASGCFFAVWFYHHKGKTADLQKDLSRDEDELLSSLPGQPKRFTFNELRLATWEFSQKLGMGGFGSVYKGMLPDGSTVAVKQLESTTMTTQGMKEFRNEVVTLSNINHQNLVHLRGFCADGVHRLLVYEYVPYGSLDTWLFRMGCKSPNPPLDWKTRLSIAIHTARGLVFLHEQCRNRIVHLDIKPQNILLDESFTAKLSDFGLSRLVNEDEVSAVTRMRGTPGYMAPECLILSDATEKSDVYSFGMVLLEIVSGRKNVDVSRLVVHGDGDGWYFPALAARKFKEGQVLEILDKNLRELSKDELADVTRVIKIAFWCIQDDPTQRPTIGNALLMLEGYSQVASPPLSFHFGMRFHLPNSKASSPRTPSKIPDGGNHLVLEEGDETNGEKKEDKLTHAQGRREDETNGDKKEDKPAHDQGRPEDQASPLSSPQPSPHGSPSVSLMYKFHMISPHPLLNSPLSCDHDASNNNPRSQNT